MLPDIGTLRRVLRGGWYRGFPLEAPRGGRGVDRTSDAGRRGSEGGRGRLCGAMKSRQGQQTQLLETKLVLKLLLLLLLQLQLGGEVVELRLLLASHVGHEETLVLSCHQGSLHWVELGQLLSLKLLHLELL